MKQEHSSEASWNQAFLRPEIISHLMYNFAKHLSGGLLCSAAFSEQELSKAKRIQPVVMPTSCLEPRTAVSTAGRRERRTSSSYRRQKQQQKQRPKIGGTAYVF